VFVLFEAGHQLEQIVGYGIDVHLAGDASLTHDGEVSLKHDGGVTLEK